jgi:hypothetical protein
MFDNPAEHLRMAASSNIQRMRSKIRSYNRSKSRSCAIGGDRKPLVSGEANYLADSSE